MKVKDYFEEFENIGIKKETPVYITTVELFLRPVKKNYAHYCLGYGDREFLSSVDILEKECYEMRIENGNIYLFI